MREIYLVRADADAPVQAFATYPTAWLRKVELEKTWGDSPSIETVQIEEFKLRSYNSFGSSAQSTL